MTTFKQQRTQSITRDHKTPTTTASAPGYCLPDYCLPDCCLLPDCCPRLLPHPDIQTTTRRLPDNNALPPRLSPPTIAPECCLPDNCLPDHPRLLRPRRLPRSVTSRLLPTTRPRQSKQQWPRPIKTTMASGLEEEFDLNQSILPEPIHLDRANPFCQNQSPCPEPIHSARTTRFC